MASSLASQRIYFVMVDRYANGDPANDRGGRTGNRGVTGFDPTDQGWYHGGDFKGLTGDCTGTTRGLARLKALGFTAVWVTPPYGQKTAQGDSAAYHGYWGLDFSHVDPHLGTDADFGDFVGCAHRLGLKVYLDVVLNHTADVIIPGGGTSYVGQDQVPYRDCHGKKFNPARYATGKAFPCLKVATMPRVPVVLSADRNVKKPAWLNDPLRYHNRGDVNFDSCDERCYEQGDFFGLDDLFTEQPAVVNGLAAIYAGWIKAYKLDGFRIDTARHVNAAFFHVWIPQILAAAREAGVSDFQIFGEVYLTSALDLAPFVRDRGLPNVLDFPLQDAATGYAAGTTNARAIGRRLEADDYFRTPSGVEPTPPTFLGNHDMGRAALKIKEQAAGLTPDELLKRTLLGYDLLYLLRGAPVVYYGDEAGMIGTGGDKQARQDMFPTQVREWRTAERLGGSPIGTGSWFDVSSPVAGRLKELAALRDAHPALSTGATVVRLASGRLLAVSRIDAGARREYVAALNAGTSAATLTVPTSTVSAAWVTLYGGAAEVTSGADGRLRVTVPPLSAVLLRAGTSLPGGLSGTPVLKVGPDDLTTLLRASVTLPGLSPASVAFAVRRPGASAWSRLAVDDSAPYAAYLDPRRYPKGRRVYVVAVARGLDGTTRVSKVVTVMPRRG